MAHILKISLHLLNEGVKEKESHQKKLDEKKRTGWIMKAMVWKGKKQG